MSKTTDWIIEQEARGEIVFNEQESVYEPRNKARCEHGSPDPGERMANAIRSDVSEGRVDIPVTEDEVARRLSAVEAPIGVGKIDLGQEFFIGKHQQGDQLGIHSARRARNESYEQHNLPPTIVSALSRDDYTRGKTMVCHQLIDSPQVRILQERHWDSLTEDVGEDVVCTGHCSTQGVRGSRRCHQRGLFVGVDDWVIGGAIDLQDARGIVDYKCTSVWSVIHDKIE